MIDWQPIETAPKDEDVEVLLFGPLGDIWHVACGTRSDADLCGWAWALESAPTHWAPLNLPEPGDA